MKISVAMCTYNGDKYLNNQIESIINQSTKVDEIVICDDGSTDKTIEITEKYQNSFPNLIKLYRNETTLKSVKNFEKSINLCSGDIIFLSDQDDIWLENKVETIVNFFDNNPKIDCVATNGYLINDENNLLDLFPIWDIFIELEKRNIKYDYFKSIILAGNFATGATIAFRKKIIPSIFPFPIIKDFHHDEWIALILSEQDKFSFINDKLIKYRLHENQQVGGVSYKNTSKQIKLLVQMFDLSIDNCSFIVLKAKLKRVINAYNKKLPMLTKNNVLFKDYKDFIKTYIEDCKKTMYKKNPLFFSLIRISDYILNKRQINL